MPISTLSIIVPFYNEQENIQAFWKELQTATRPLKRYKIEYIFIDDGSSDRTWEILVALSRKNTSLLAIRLGKNFGHQAALLVGYDFATSKYILTLDGDLQHPPSLIPSLLSKAEEGADIVQALRQDNPQVSGRLKRLTSAWFYSVFQYFSGVPLVAGAADYRLISRRVLEYLQQHPEKEKFLRGLLVSFGFTTEYVPYIVQKRYAGHTKMSWRKMIHFALNGIVSFSTLPLRMATVTGGVIALLGFFYLGFVVLQKLLEPQTVVEGWATVVVLVLLISGVQLVMLGVVGEYIAAIFREVKQRPAYWVSEVAGKKRERRANRS